MSWRLTAALVAIGALGCGGDAPLTFLCARVDPCATVPIERVNATCGTGATSAAPDGTTLGGNTIDDCTYRSDSNVESLFIYRGCFELKSSAAIVYRGAHDDTSSASFVREEIDGLGDSTCATSSAPDKPVGPIAEIANASVSRCRRWSSSICC